MANYVFVNGELHSTDELYHYGVVGMKWGIRRANLKSQRYSKLQKKALELDKKSANFAKKSEKAHANLDLNRSNKASIKAAKLDKKAATIEIKSTKASTDLARDRLHKKAEKLKYKAANKRLDGNRISKTTGYGAKAMKYSVKSDKVAKKAAKVRMKMANDKYYISKMNSKISQISREDLQAGYSFINDMKKF